MATELEEVLQFLSSPSPQVKKAAVDIVRDLTGSENELKALAHYSETVLASLSRLLGEKKEISEPAAKALVNLSQKPDISKEMVEKGMTPIVMETLYRQDPDIIRLLVMLLVNLTQLEEGVMALLQTEIEKMQGLYVMKLVRSFCTSSSEKIEDPFEHVGLILINITKVEKGRKYLLDPKRGLLKQIIRQFDSTSQLRKKGVCGTVRNCCFEADKQLHHLLLVSEYLWPALLLPVAGKKVYSEQDTSKMPPEIGTALSIERESVDDPEIRIQALEAIYLITLQEAGRRALWSVNGPKILEIGYEDEEDAKVMDAYERVGSLLVQGTEIEETSSESK
ncbi:Hgh1-like protein [Thalictrum thalictroides]|uniref:Protein HGH1 homolog n=1 Tax=Thalictrum thalictroides TaxID=46969 RepID=A0A7J6VH04_THATH|nr:Hgh1-like protein [Thalictrum thalictroides]